MLLTETKIPTVLVISLSGIILQVNHVKTVNIHVKLVVLILKLVIVVLILLLEIVLIIVFV